MRLKERSAENYIDIFFAQDRSSVFQRYTRRDNNKFQNFLQDVLTIQSVNEKYDGSEDFINDRKEICPHEKFCLRR